MTKDIKVTADGPLWSARWGLFEWTLEYISRSIGDGALSAQIAEIIDENLRWFSLPAQPPDLRRRVAQLLSTSLVAEAERSLPEWEGRSGAIDHLRELADVARAAEA